MAARQRCVWKEKQLAAAFSSDGVDKGRLAEMLPDKGRGCAIFAAAGVDARAWGAAKGRLGQQLSMKSERFDVRYGNSDGIVVERKRRGLAATRTDRLC